jgi:hypothetical protein
MEKARDRIASGSTVVIIAADSGYKYLDTIYDDEWVGAPLSATAAAAV